MLQEDIIWKEDTETELDDETIHLLYGVVDTNDNSWYLAKTKSIFIKGTRCLYKLGCIPSKGPVSQPTPEPQIGQRGHDIYGNLWEIKTKDWF